MSTHHYRRLLLTAVAAVAALTVTACDPGPAPDPTASVPATADPSTATSADPTAGPEPADPPPTAAAIPPVASGWPVDADGAPVGWQLCQSPPRGLAIRYPAGWLAASDCSLFDPTFIGPGDTVIDLTLASQLNQTAAGWLATLSPTEYVVLSEAVTVDGLAATRYELTWLSFPTTTPPGSHRYGYLFERGNQLVDVFTVALPTEDYPAKRTIVDQAATTVAWLH